MSYQINAMRDQQKAMVWTVVALRNAIRRASRADTTPDFRTIQRLMNYIERVTEQQQQVNEERHLFRLLEKRIPAMTRTMSRLRRDHVAMKGYRMRLAETVNYWRQGDPKSARHAPVVAHDYLDFCERHVRAERDLLPALRKVLSDDEWSGIDRVFASVDDPMARGRSRREREAALETFD
ncbi:MAG: hemerythrin domain-containing protein [Alphaproteobacteria bacterium]|nr:hemerythrin domain-containing protein [Alphaproteobacteria bacterium]